MKYAFVHAFYHLYKQTPYREAIEETLKIKGDTNVNAMMVGGLLAASQGLKSSQIDTELIRKIFSTIPNDSQQNPRPDFLIPGLYLSQKLTQIFISAPTELKVGYKGLVLTNKDDIRGIINDVDEQYIRSL